MNLPDMEPETHDPWREVAIRVIEQALADAVKPNVNTRSDDTKEYKEKLKNETQQDAYDFFVDGRCKFWLDYINMFGLNITAEDCLVAIERRSDAKQHR